MKIDYFYELLNKEDYSEDNWKKGEKYQLEIFNKTISMVKDLLKKNGIRLYDNGAFLKFDHINASAFRGTINYAELGHDEGGDHDAKTGVITLNKNLLLNDGNSAFETLCHEIAHELEVVMVLQMNKYPKDSREYKYLEMLKGEIFHEISKMSAFGIDIDGPHYLNPQNIEDNWGVKTKDLAYAFYALQVSERSAFATEGSAFFHVNSEAIDLTQKAASDIIRKMYGDRDLTYDEICNLIDKAKTNLLLGQSPNKDANLEAAITYDLAVCLKIQIFELEKRLGLIQRDEFDRREECMMLLNAQERRSRLTSYYEPEGKTFVAPNDNLKINGVKIINDINHNAVVGLSELKELGIDGQKANPKTVALAIYARLELALPYIKKEVLDVLNKWYFSDQNDLSEDEMNEISKAFKGERHLITLQNGTKVNEYSFAGQQVRKKERLPDILKENPHLVQEPIALSPEVYRNKGFVIEEKENVPWFVKLTSKSSSKKKLNHDIER